MSRNPWGFQLRRKLHHFLLKMGGLPSQSVKLPPMQGEDDLLEPYKLPQLGNDPLPLKGQRFRKNP
jgi:hypothetical protein